MKQTTQFITAPKLRQWILTFTVLIHLNEMVPCVYSKKQQHITSFNHRWWTMCNDKHVELKLSIIEPWGLQCHFYVSSEFFIPVNIKMIVFWNVAPYSFVDTYQCSGIYPEEGGRLQAVILQKTVNLLPPWHHNIKSLRPFSGVNVLLLLLLLA
jgi:hypothetical protein